MGTKWCTDVLSDRPQWKHSCNKQKVKRWNMYDLNLGDRKQQLFLYQVYCAKKMMEFNQDDFTGSSRQLQKIQQYLGSNSFKFCRPFEMMIRRKTSALSVARSTSPPISTDRRNGAHSSPSTDSKNSDLSSSPSSTEEESSPPLVSVEDISDASTIDTLSTPVTTRTSYSKRTDVARSLLTSENDVSSSSSDELSSKGSTATAPPVLDNNKQQQRRRQQGDVFMEGIKAVNVGTYFRSKCDGNMSNRLWQQRSDMALQHLMCICGYSKIKDYNELEKNEEIFKSVLDLIIHIKARLMKHTKLTVSAFERENDEENKDFRSLPDDEVNQDESTAFDFMNQKEFQSEEERKESTEELEEKLLSSLSKQRFESVRKIINELKLTTKEGGGVTIRSRYKIYKEVQKNINTFTVDPSHLSFVLEGFDGKMFESKHEKETAFSELEKIYNTIEERETPVKLHGASLSMQSCYNAIIAKIDRARKKYLRENKDEELSLETLLQDGYFVGVPDGAVHNALSYKNNGIVTYSIAMVSHNLAKYLGITPLSATNIITQCQINGPENRGVLYAVTKDRFTEFNNVKQYAGTNLPFYDMADAKAVYSLLGHSHWQRKHHPFLGCACSKGDGGKHNHICVQWTDETYSEKSEKSKLRWSKREAISRIRKAPYTIEDHKDWCDQKNDGICHFGVVPEGYNFASSMRYDVFHGRGNIGKKMIAYIHKLLDGNYTNLEQFAFFLQTLKSWGDYEISPWLTGDGVARLKGVHIKQFVKQVDDVTTMLSSLCLPHEVKHINIALKAFAKVSKILSFIFIDDYDDVKEFLSDSQLNKSSPKEEIASAIVKSYKKYAKEFYDAGMKSFMTTSTMGDSETFYVHNIVFYMPSIIQDTYEKHKLGPGVWSMEGFEYKNAQSKRAVYTHSNRKGNLPAQSLAHLFLIYTMGRHEPLKKKGKKKKQLQVMPTINEEVTNIVERV